MKKRFLKRQGTLLVAALLALLMCVGATQGEYPTLYTNDMYGINVTAEDIGESGSAIAVFSRSIGSSGAAYSLEQYLPLAEGAAYLVLDGFMERPPDEAPADDAGEESAEDMLEDELAEGEEGAEEVAEVFTPDPVFNYDTGAYTYYLAATDFDEETCKTFEGIVVENYEEDIVELSGDNGAINLHKVEIAYTDEPVEQPPEGVEGEETGQDEQPPEGEEQQPGEGEQPSDGEGEQPAPEPPQEEDQPEPPQEEDRPEPPPAEGEGQADLDSGVDPDFEAEITAEEVPEAEVQVTDFYAEDEEGQAQQSACRGDKLILTFEASAPVVVDEENSLIAGKAASWKSSDGLTWRGARLLTNTDGLNGGDLLSFEVLMEDEEGREYTLTEADSPALIDFIDAPPAPEEAQPAVSFVADGGTKGYARRGDKLVLTIEMPYGVAIDEGASAIAGKAASWTAHDDGATWRGAVLLSDTSGLKDGDRIPFAVSFADEWGRSYSLTQDDAAALSYAGPLKEAITSITFYAASGDDGQAKQYAVDGDQLYLNIKANRELKVVSSDIDGKEPLWRVANRRDITGTRLLYETKNLSDGQPLAFSVTLVDNFGEEVSINQNDTEAVTYYAPLSVYDVQFYSDNPVSANYAVAGTNVTVTFKTNHPARIDAMNIGGVTVFPVSQNDEGMVWSAAYQPGRDTFKEQFAIGFKLMATDKLSGNSVTLDNKSAGLASITFFEPIAVRNLTIKSNSEKDPQTIAEVGDTVTVSFSTNRVVVVSEASIAGYAVEFVSPEGINWSASYKIREGDLKDAQAVPVRFAVNDWVGNATVVGTEKDRVQNKVLRFQGPLKVSGVRMETSNQRNSSRYAKYGDAVSVKFTTNHMVDIKRITANIAGKQPFITYKRGDLSPIAVDWTLSYVLKYNDTSGDAMEIPFSFTVREDDIAITKQNGSEGVENKIYYYKPVRAITTLSSDKTKAVNADGNIELALGDVMIIKINTNHNAFVREAKIGGVNPIIQGDGSNEITLRAKLHQNSTLAQDGAVEYRYTLEDAAGNKLNVYSRYEQEKFMPKQ